MSVTRILEALDFATAYVNKMEAEIATLRAVHAEAMELLREVDELLESVEKMEGAFSRDPEVHKTNIIEGHANEAEKIRPKIAAYLEKHDGTRKVE